MPHAANHTLGIMLSLGAMILFCLSDAVAKHFFGVVSVFHVMAIGYSVAALLGFVHARMCGISLTSGNRRVIAIYGVLNLLEMFAFFFALKHMEFSIVFVFVMAIPLVAAKMANILLKEPLSMLQHIALVVAFAGVLATVFLRHDGVNVFEVTIWGVVFAVLDIVLCAGKMVFLKRYGAHENAETMNFWALVIMALGGLALALIDGRPVPWAWDLSWLLLYPVGVFVGGLLYVLSYRYAPATMIAPVMYSQLIGAIAIGALFFHEPVTLPLMIGSALVIAAGFLFYWPGRKAPV